MKLSSIQALRFFAAMLVVAMHATQGIADNIHKLGQHIYWERGSTGVHIFFVISGFVMFLTAPKDSNWSWAWSFFKKRLIRVVPPYWIYTILKVALIVAAAHHASSTTAPSAGNIIKSLFFIPHLDANGNYFPILQVGWTLNYEMLFYLVFSMAIMLNGKYRLAATTIILTGIFLLAATAAHSSPLSFYGRGILFEFVLGIIAGMIYKRNLLPGRTISFALAALSLYTLFLTPPQPNIDSFITAGIPSFTLLISLLTLQKTKIIGNLFELLSPLGDASYSIYLVHPFVIALVSRALSNLMPPDWASLIILCIASIAISWWSYKIIETPLSRALSRKPRRAMNASISTAGNNDQNPS